MYVTAGLGPKETNEGFTEPYDLPNETAYAETCASVALVFWAHRMLHLDLDGRYADVMELALLQWRADRARARRDALLLFQSARESRPASAVGLARLPLLHDERVAARRVGRPAMPSRRATTASPSISTAAFETTATLAGVKVALRETSDYPWSGEVRIDIDPEAPAAFDLKLRIPGWARGATAAVNGEPIALEPVQRLRHHPPRLAQGRRGDARSQDAGRAALRASECAHGCRARGAAGAAR